MTRAAPKATTASKAVQTAFDAEELAWARECAAAGLDLIEIAEAADRPISEIGQMLADLKPMTAQQREVASLFAAGLTCQAIAERVGRRGRHAKNSIQSDLRRLRRRGYPIPIRTDRWTERRRAMVERHQEQTS